MKSSKSSRKTVFHLQKLNLHMILLTPLYHEKLWSQATIIDPTKWMLSRQIWIQNHTVLKRKMVPQFPWKNIILSSINFILIQSNLCYRWTSEEEKKLSKFIYQLSYAMKQVFLMNLLKTRTKWGIYKNSNMETQTNEEIRLYRWFRSFQMMPCYSYGELKWNKICWR